MVALHYTARMRRAGSVPWTHLLTLSLGIGLGVGLRTAAAGPAPEGDTDPAAQSVGEAPIDHNRYRKLDVLARSVALIEQRYVRPIDGDELIYAAIQGMTDALDPHTDFLPPAEARMLDEDVGGRFGGVGLVVVLTRGEGDDPQIYLEIRDVIPGGPADKAGLVAGDWIVAVKGKPVANFVDLRDAILEMRGPAGTPVRFSYVRPETDEDGTRRAVGEPTELNVTREVIDAPAVEVNYLGEGLGHLRLRDFQASSTRELRKGLATLRQEADGELRGVVLDLRDNGGGLLSQAISVVDLFVRDGVVVRTRGRRGRVVDMARATAPGTVGRLPLVVLINKGSASASEIVAGALKDHGRALLVGERTYGKGSVQTPYRLGDGSTLKLTTALFYTPNDRLIQASGVAPDVQVGATLPTYSDTRPELPSEREAPQHLEPRHFGRDHEEGAGPVSAAVEAAGADVQLRVAVQHLLAANKLSPGRSR